MKILIKKNNDDNNNNKNNKNKIFKWIKIQNKKIKIDEYTIKMKK